MRTWLVTGGAGFIGENFVMRALQHADVRIINLGSYRMQRIGQGA